MPTANRELDTELGRKIRPQTHVDQRSSNAQNKSLVFLAMFEPWEVDEIACVRDFVMRKILRGSSKNAKPRC